MQFLPGYCVLLVDTPNVQRLTDLPRRRRTEFLADLEILGNTDPYLHAHIWPRYDWEPPHLVGRPVWLYPLERWSDPATALGPEHDDLRAELTAEIDRLLLSRS